MSDNKMQGKMCEPIRQEVTEANTEQNMSSFEIDQIKRTEKVEGK